MGMAKNNTRITRFLDTLALLLTFAICRKYVNYIKGIKNKYMKLETKQNHDKYMFCRV